MKKILAPLLALTVLGMSGCDLSMNKNKGAKTNKSDNVNLDPIANAALEQQPIPESAITYEPPPKTKQAVDWQNMNLASSTNDNGQAITIDYQASQQESHSVQEEPEIEEYFQDFKQDSEN